jgi:hypothetical protein
VPIIRKKGLLTETLEFPRVESENAVWFGKRGSRQMVGEVGVDLRPLSGSRDFRRFVRRVGPGLSIERRG